MCRDENDSTLLHKAAAYGQLSIIQLLLKDLPSSMLQHVDNFFLTPAMLAIQVCQTYSFCSSCSVNRFLCVQLNSDLFWSKTFVLDSTIKRVLINTYHSIKVAVCINEVIYQQQFSHAYGSIDPFS